MPPTAFEGNATLAHNVIYHPLRAFGMLSTASCLQGDALSALPNFRSLSHLSLSCSSFSNPETFRHICRCGALWRNNGARDRSCASDPGQHCAASSDLEDSFQGEYVVTRSMSECHPAPVHADAASFMRSRAVPETSSMGQLPIHSANSTDGYPLSASGAQCYRSLLSLDVSGISFSDGDLASILSSHPKLVALAVSTGAAANTGMRAATDLCDLRHLDISFLGFARGGEQFASDATKATALSETLTALCNAATKRITAGLEARSPSVDPSQEVLAALCDNAPWWRAPSNPAASSARKSGIPHATVEPFATFHLAIDLQLLIAFSRSWLRRSFATIPDRGLTVRHHTPFTTHPGAPSSHKEDSEQSLIAAVSPEPSRILHVLLPEIIVGPARLSHFELCGIETTESLLRHLLRIETPPMAAIRLHNYDPDRPTASSVSPDPKHCECSCSGDDDNTQSDGTLIAEQLQNSSLCDSLDSHNTPDKKAKLEASVSRNMECASSPFDTDDAEEHKSAAEQCSVHRAVPSHPLQGSMSAVISGTMPRCSCNGSAATPLPPAASTSGGKRRSMDGDWVRHRDAEQVPSGRRGGRRYAGSRSTEQGDSAQTMPRRSTLQSVLLAARWRRPSSAILRQIVDVHGEGLRCLHLSDLAGVTPTCSMPYFIHECLRVSYIRRFDRNTVWCAYHVLCIRIAGNPYRMHPGHIFVVIVLRISYLCMLDPRASVNAGLVGRCEQQHALFILSTHLSCSVWLAGVNDTVMRRLQSHAPHLSSLTLSGTCPVTAAGIQVLRNMNLQSLHLCKLSEPQIGDQVCCNSVQDTCHYLSYSSCMSC